MPKNHNPAPDGGAEARALLLPLAERVACVVEGVPCRAWPPVSRLLKLGKSGPDQLGRLWRGERSLTAGWRARLRVPS